LSNFVYHEGVYTAGLLEWGRRWQVAFLLWAVVVLLFAAQWYAYDASRAGAEPLGYYVFWAIFTGAVLAPTACWLGWRFPIAASNWQRRLLLHFGASFGLTAAQLFFEAYLGRLRHPDLSLPGALRHYFVNYGQVSLLTYWAMLAVALFYQTQEDARESSLRSARLQSQLSAARLDMLRRQLQPHFLFNTLQAATTLVQEDPDRAEEVLLRLSELLRVSLYGPEQQEIPLQREMEILDHYMAIQMCRFGDRLRFDIHVDANALACAVPSFVLQPLVENAVRHGIGMCKQNDVITIAAFRENESLRLEVSNLASALKAPAEQLFGKGVGLTTTRERLKVLYGQEHFSFGIANVDPKGVRAAIVLPFRTLSESNSSVEEVPGDSRADR
jgi:two-component system, LytTR family, sensor kinase